MRSSHVFAVGVLLLLVMLSCDVCTVEARRCTRICEKGRCRPVCTREAEFVDDSPIDGTEMEKKPDNP
ncbi:uncharacterized protein CDAR_504881 [Caerostris darwini]|uniref:Uncharacterized protein n=1 Tax=Caerostris darwini TaxID=1538125 RepID=A0AAV4VRE1_9ARAC|nr:uncharacterized protein CDAR_504881 [Caerostris darwini]